MDHLKGKQLSTDKSSHKKANQDNEQPPDIILFYDWNNDFSLTFQNELEQALSESFSVQVKHEMRGASSIIPMLEIVLATSTATVTTSILNKFGEDIYNKLKNKFTAKRFDKSQKMCLNITIFTQDAVFNGYVRFDDYQSAIEALKYSKMIAVGETKYHINLEDLPENHLVRREQFIPKGCNICFTYEYNIESSKWDLKRITKLKN